ncbi:MAG: oxygen-independent coproporphyrinogen III oxidase [Spongiibacteraceae bacterium]
MSKSCIVTSTANPKFNLARYDVRSPRYTSYPTALQFRSDFSVDDYAKWWPNAATDITPLSLYVHIPFCRDICYYCGCNKIVTRRAEEARRYLHYLKMEIAMQAEIVGSRRPVLQLHLGGGSPTYLSGAELTELVYSLASHFNLVNSGVREYSIEIDPRTVDRGMLALLKGLNFNRISFGVQDFADDVQRAINRIQPLSMVAELTESARAFAFDSINFDLIYGLPLQTPASFATTLREVIALRPDRIALYNYAHLPERFSSQRALDRLPRPSAAEKLALLDLASEKLTAAGYLHIGMDHFVLPNDALAIAQQQHKLERNFQGYSTCHAPDLIGLGVSAIGSSNYGFAQNAKDLENYYRLLDNGQLPLEKGLLVDDDDRIRKYVIMQIICNLQLTFAELKRLHGIDFFDYFANAQPALQQLQNDGLIALDDEALTVAQNGRPFLRNICMTFDRYLEPADALAAATDVLLNQQQCKQHSRAL